MLLPELRIGRNARMPQKQVLKRQWVLPKHLQSANETPNASPNEAPYSRSVHIAEREPINCMRLRNIHRKELHGQK